MNKHCFWIVGSIILLLVAINAQAFNFTIQLHNGNQVNTNKYWEDGDKISFYDRSGTVSLPKSMIKNITRYDSLQESEPLYVSPALLGDEYDELDLEETLPEEGSGFTAEQTEEFIQDLRDRLSIIAANLENLNRNKEMFRGQRQGYEQDQEKARARIAEVKKDSVMGLDEMNDRIQLENAKIQDAEDKMARVDEQLRTNARLIDAQYKMKSRLEGELAGLTTQ
jgi:hypothetical protein